NPSLERYIPPPISTFRYIMAQYWDAQLTIARFSAEPPVIRGHGRSPASSCLFVRDQKSAYASHFRPCWQECRHKEGNEVVVVARSCLSENASSRAEHVPNPFSPYAAWYLWQSGSRAFAAARCAPH